MHTMLSRAESSFDCPGIALRIGLSHVYEIQPLHELPQSCYLHGSRDALKDVKDVRLPQHRMSDKPHAYTRQHDYREGQEPRIGAPPRPRLTESRGRGRQKCGSNSRRDILRFVRDLYNCTVCLGQGAGRQVYSILSISDRCTPFRLHEFSRAPSSHSQAATCLS